MGAARAAPPFAGEAWHTALELSSPHCPTGGDSAGDDSNLRHSAAPARNAHSASAPGGRRDRPSPRLAAGPLGVRREWTAWLAALGLPLGALVALRLADGLDRRWYGDTAHFWLVLVDAVLAAGLGLLMSQAGSRRADARVLLAGLACLASAGFLGLHALATPGVLLDRRSVGFVIATPVGLIIAAGFAAASSIDFDASAAAAVMRRQRVLRLGLAAVLVAWAAISLIAGSPLGHAIGPERASSELAMIGLAGVALYAVAAGRYARMLRRRPSRLLCAFASAWILLAEALVAVAVAPSWYASWWEWHLLVTLAVFVVAWAVDAEYRRLSPPLGPFTNLYLEHTIGRVDADYAEALDELVAAHASGAATEAHADALGNRLGLSGDERRVLQRAAGEIDRVDRLFRPYVPAQLARELAVDPTRARLGGEEREVSLLFADLQGFTAFSEQASPAVVIAMLNEYWSLVVPEVLGREDGLIERFSGDAIMVMFNATGEQPDHALRAARAALALQRASSKLTRQHPDWPRFRVGVNTGWAIVGNVGTADQRSFAAIGDATNHAARLQAAAAPGEIVIGETTRLALAGTAELEPLEPLYVKGKRVPVVVHRLVAIADHDA
jgi:adenylate cyclase